MQRLRVRGNPMPDVLMFHFSKLCQQWKIHWNGVFNGSMTPFRWIQTTTTRAWRMPRKTLYGSMCSDFHCVVNPILKLFCSNISKFGQPLSSDVFQILWLIPGFQGHIPIFYLGGPYARSCPSRIDCSQHLVPSIWRIDEKDKIGGNDKRGVISTQGI